MSYRTDNERFATQIKVPHDVFGKPTVVVELPSGAEGSPGAAAAFVLASNLLCRIFERIYLVAPNLDAGRNPWGLVDLQASAAVLDELAVGHVRWGYPTSTPDIVLGIGARPTIKAAEQTFVSFSPWTAGVEVELPAAPNAVVGPLLAACFGASQAFLLSAKLVGAAYRPMPPFKFSALTYQEEDRVLEPRGEILVPTSHLVGVGAVGSAMVYALGYSDARGVIHAIDDDAVDDTNLQRYALMRQSDVGAAKVDVARRCLERSGIDVVPHQDSFKTYAKKHGTLINVLITPVDSEVGRRKLAGYLPRAVLNAATGHTKVTISSHGFADGRACLSCLYFPDAKTVTTESRLAEDMGLTLEEVEEHLANNTPVNEALVRRIEEHRGLPQGKLADSVGRRIQSLYQRTVCGEAAIQVAGATVVSPLSFISATAGVLLAGELLKLGNEDLRGFALNNYFRLDTLCKPNSSVRSMRPQEASRRCICHDLDYVEVYRSKYG